MLRAGGLGLPVGLTAAATPNTRPLEASEGRAPPTLHTNGWPFKSSQKTEAIGHEFPLYLPTNQTLFTSFPPFCLHVRMTPPLPSVLIFH